ncbi:cytochrome P450 [Ideonella sp. DXS22W]|uniref:Cytochrome P450 n=1 Tax=Pseudaquabacterium inlustre TaxID=2984192 RepID=A0ABU9CJ56_9BURK
MNPHASLPSPHRSDAAAAPSAPPAARPPGPPTPWWGLGTMRAMRADYLGFVTRLQRQHGDVTFMQLVHEQAYDLFAPELIRQVLVDQHEQLQRWERGPEVFAELVGQNVLVTEGATWQRQRRMLQPGFTPRRVAGYGRLMVDAARHALDMAVMPGADRADVDMDALFTRLTMDVILRTLFGAAATARESADAAWAVKTANATAMREMFWPVTLPDWLPLPGKADKRRAIDILHSLVRRHIARRQAAPADPAPADDLLAMLLAVRDDHGAGLDPQELMDQCLVTFTAGHDTTASALLWWSAMLAHHPEAAARAQAEVDALLAGRDPTADDLPQLAWLGATLKETLRLYPPLGALMTRRTRAPVQAGPWTIPAGALVRISPWVVQRDARWFPDPETFRPERFLPVDRGGDAPPPRGAWLPFGTGPRVCIGQHFALLEMTLVAAMLLQRYRLAPISGQPLGAPEMQVTLRPAGGLRLQLSRR